MDLTFWMMAATAVMVGVVGWKRLPIILASAHQKFRDEGSAQVFRRDGGRLVSVGVTVPASECRFASEATFVLLPPLVRSKAVADVGEQTWRFNAVTRWPSMKTVFILD